MAMTPIAEITETHQVVTAALPSTTAMLGQVGLTLALIVLLIICLAWLSKRLSRNYLLANSKLKVTASLMLGRKEKLVLVEVEGKKILLGVGDGTVSLLTELEGGELRDTPSSTLSEGSANGELSQSNRSDQPLVKSSSEFSGFLHRLLEKGA